jgi:transcriptional regulator with XRE-family HTH domain
MLENRSKETVAGRLRYFAHLRFGSIKELATAMRVSPSTLSQYTTGKCVPGNLMQKRLRELGCDIEWLITGESVTHELKNIKSEFAYLMSEYRVFHQRLTVVEQTIDVLKNDNRLAGEG